MKNILCIVTLNQISYIYFSIVPSFYARALTENMSLIEFTHPKGIHTHGAAEAFSDSISCLFESSRHRNWAQNPLLNLSRRHPHDAESVPGSTRNLQKPDNTAQNATQNLEMC